MVPNFFVITVFISSSRSANHYAIAFQQPIAEAAYYKNK